MDQLEAIALISCDQEFFFADTWSEELLEKYHEELTNRHTLLARLEYLKIRVEQYAHDVLMEYQA